MSYCLWSFCLPLVVGGEFAGEAVVVCRWCIPAAAQGPEGGDGGTGRLGLCLGFGVAYQQQVPFGIEYLDQADDAALIGCKRVLARLGKRRLTPSQDANLGLSVDQGGEGVFDILGRPQYGQPVGRQGFGLLATGGGDLRIDAAEVEQAPAQAEDALGLAGGPGEQIAAGDCGGAAQEGAKRE